MAIHLRKPETDRLIRRLAESRGIGLTEAVHEAVEEALHRDEMSEAEQGRLLRERLAPLLESLDQLPRTGEKADKRFFDEMWGQEDD
jgi:antitoxin VapB